MKMRLPHDIAGGSRATSAKLQPCLTNSNAGSSFNALIIGYCGLQRRGQMIGTYYLVRELIVSNGALAGALLWKLDPGVNFASDAIFGAPGTNYYCSTTRLCLVARPRPENSGA
jgi:hypothetical protein